MSIILKTENLTKTYKLGKVEVPALRGVSIDRLKRANLSPLWDLRDAANQRFCICSAVCFHRRAGKFIIADEDLSKVSDAQRTDIRRRKIGFVFQRFNLFPTLTAEGNLKLAEKIHSGNGGDPTRRREVLSLLKLENKMNHKPLEMSGGEQQRVALARAVVNNPAIILADEPTGNLDTENSDIVLNMFRQLNKKFNQTIIMITHNPEAAAVCSRIIRMRDGLVDEE